MATTIAGATNCQAEMPAEPAKRVGALTRGLHQLRSGAGRPDEERRRLVLDDLEVGGLPHVEARPPAELHDFAVN